MSSKRRFHSSARRFAPQTASSRAVSPSRPARVLLLVLALLVLFAGSACAQSGGSGDPNGDPMGDPTYVSTLRTAYFPVYDDQLMIATVADLAGDASPGASIAIRFYDIEDQLLHEKRGELFPSEPVSGRIDSAVLVFEDGRALVRVEIEASSQLQGAVPVSTIERIEIGGFTAEPDFKCAGPPMDCGPDFVCQIICPGTVLVTDILY